ncbi:MAG: Hsp70 family protein [Lachnospiraceae bacterium]|nr:Hsp70 family protein [Lachnospiraceae bacterium]
MGTYVGIDLGTTNSAICTFDGVTTRVWKSPEQADVTPSAIYIDKRGHRFYGRRALDLAASAEQNSATLFKRYLGTNKPFEMKDAGVTLTPVECASELLGVLFGYLPEEIRKDPETVTVITVPAAFNQMKKDATKEAAEKAGIGRVALMQEPVAAVMSVLKNDPGEKLFLIYDLGGGTFDISVAQHIGGHVSLLAQGGREMCGGRDQDRWIYRTKILPYLREHFALPEEPDEDERFLAMKRTALFAAERAKIELASSEETTIWLDEQTLHTQDLNGEGIYLDLTLTRSDLEESVRQMAEATVDVTLDTMRKAGVTRERVDQILFVGGPTMYAPLREEVCRRLEIPRGTAVNPMTAVAEGAAIYAESINWEDDGQKRKERFGEYSENEQVRVRYEARTTSPKGKIAILAEDHERRIARVVSYIEHSDAEPKAAPGGTYSGVIPEAKDGSKGASAYDSGPVSVVRQGVITVPLDEPGIHRFLLTVKDPDGCDVIEPKQIEITRTLAQVTSIPASHSVAVKALDRPGGTPVPVYLVEANDPLPKSGSCTFRAAERLIGGSPGALTFSLWEGEIQDPVDDNRYIGTFRIPGTAFEYGVIEVGTEVICDYEMNESGTLRLGVSVPAVDLQMKEKNFYSRYEGQSDLTDVSGLIKEINELLERTAQMKRHVSDPEVQAVRGKLHEMRAALSRSIDPEVIAEVELDLLDAYKRVSNLHMRYRNVMASRDLEQVISEFRQYEKYATEDEKASFDNLVESARYSIDMGSSDFEMQLLELWRRVGNLRWKDDGHIRLLFMYYTRFFGNYSDKAAFHRLRAEGLACMENGDMDGVREVILKLSDIRIVTQGTKEEAMLEEVGIYR